MSKFEITPEGLNVENFTNLFILNLIEDAMVFSKQ